MNVAERMARDFAVQIPTLVVRKDLCCLPSTAHIMRAVCFERSPTDRHGCYVVCFFILPATRKQDVALSNGFRLRRNGRETTWQEVGDSVELAKEFYATGVPFFDSVATLSGVESYLSMGWGQRRPPSLRQQESMIYCLLLQKRYDDAYRFANELLEAAEEELKSLYQGNPDPTDWCLKLKTEISHLRDLIANRDAEQIRRVLDDNEKVTYKALSWPAACINQGS